MHFGNWGLEKSKIVQAREGVGVVTSQLCLACFEYLKLQLFSLLLPPLLFVYYSRILYAISRIFTAA